MKLKYLVVAILAVALLLAGVAWSLDSGIWGRPTAGGGSHGTSGPGSASSSPAASHPLGEGASAGVSSPVRKSPDKLNISIPAPTPSSSAPTDDRAAKATRPSWNPQPTASETAGLEMPTATPGAHKTLPKSQVKKPTFTAPPKNSVARGKLTAGFPKKAVPVPAHLKITSSSVTAQGTRVLVGVDGRSKSSTASILAFFARDLGAKGWTTTRYTPAEGTTMLRGAHGSDVVVATVRQLPTGHTALTVAATFTVGE